MDGITPRNVHVVQNVVVPCVIMSIIHNLFVKKDLELLYAMEYPLSCAFQDFRALPSSSHPQIPEGTPL